MKSVAKLVAVALGVALLAGCGVTEKAGAAAVVDGSRMTNEEVLADYQGIAQALNAPSQLTAADTNRLVIRYFVLWHLTGMKARELGVAVSEADVRERYNAEVSQAGSPELLAQMAAGSAIAPAELQRYLETLLNLDAISTRLNPTDADAGLQAAIDSLVALSDEVAIEISPRYGRWDAAQLIVVEHTGDTVVTESALAEMIAAGIQP